MLPAGAADVADLRRDHDFIAAPREHDAEERFTAAIAVDIRSVEEIDAEVPRTADRGERLVVRGVGPTDWNAADFDGAADGPRAEADLTDFDSCFSENAILHSTQLRHSRISRTSSISLNDRRNASVAASIDESTVTTAIARPPSDALASS